MLHFGVIEGGHNHIWGTRTIEPDVDYENDLRFVSAKIAPPLTGQRLGGIGFYRTETGQPRFNEVDGAYLFDTYVTAYTYVQGQYSFALITALSLYESLNVIEAPAYSAVYSTVLAEVLNAIETPVVIRSIPVGFAETLSVADTYVFQGVYGILLSESLFVSDTLGTNDALIAYAVNANTGALTTYNNFNINSFAQLNGKFYGMTDAGLVELTGDTDNGIAIDASIKLGTTELGTDTVATELLKRLPAVYLGVNTAGDMLLNVTANGATNTYQLTAATSTSLHTGRLLLGKGVASRYWDFELTNVDGADFTLDSITFYPVALGRRVT